MKKNSKRFVGRFLGLCMILAALILLPDCSYAAVPAEDIKAPETAGEKKDLAGLAYDHSLELEYATQFSVDYYEDGYTLISIANDGQFLLVPEEKEPPEGLSEDIAVI